MNTNCNTLPMLSLEAGAEKARASLSSLNELLDITKQFSLGKLADILKLQKIQKLAILDLYKVKKFHREHKEWEERTKKQFVGSQVKAYNRKYAQISRLHSQTLGLEETLAETQRNVLLPKFKFSIQTIELFEGGKYLEFVERDANGQLPRTVSTDQIFSLDPASLRPHPNFQDFNRLVNMEYRSRVQLQIKYEVLLRIKASLAAKNSQWATRDSKLNDFITRDLPKVVDEVHKIKTSEYEDLKYYEEDYEVEESEEIEEDEEEEGEPEEQEQEQEREGEENEEDEVIELADVESQEGTNEEQEDKEEAAEQEEKSEEEKLEEDAHMEEEEEAPVAQPADETTPVPESAEDMILD